MSLFFNSNHFESHRITVIQINAFIISTFLLLLVIIRIKIVYKLTANQFFNQPDYSRRNFNIFIYISDGLFKSVLVKIYQAVYVRKIKYVSI